MRRSFGLVPTCVELLESRRLFSGYTLGSLGYFTDGGNPRFGVISDSAGDLFGLTQAGGTNGTGSIYEVIAGTSKILTVASFPATTTGSVYPNSLAVDSSGNLFGSTDRAGTNGTGSIFEVVKDSKTITTLASFDADDSSNATGAYPEANIQLDSSGNLFGAAVDGGQVTGGTGGGTFWEYKKGASNITPLAVFPVLNPGGSTLYPSRAAFFTRDSAGNAFGVAEGNQQNGFYGYVWKIAAGSSTVTTLATFNGTNGFDPLSPVAVDSSGNVFGTTLYGGTGQIANSNSGGGVIWEVKNNSRAITDLASFTTDTGYSPDGLSMDSHGNLFGTANYGGTAAPASGTVWELPAGTSTLKVLAAFGASGGGQSPTGGVLISSTGNLFGATFDGGGPKSTGTGSVFELIAPGNPLPAGITALSAVATKTTLPSSIVAGSTAHGSVAVSVTNTGSSTAIESAIVSIYASLNGIIDTNSVMIGSVTKTVQIRAGKTSPVTVQIKSLPATLSGSYKLLAETVDAQGSTIDATTGPTVKISPAFISFSDTLIKTTLPASAISGQPTKANVQIKITSDGNIVSAGITTIALYASPDGTTINATPIRNYPTTLALKPGASKTLTIPLQAIPTLADGNYYLVARVTDPLKNDTTTKSASTYKLAAPFFALAPTIVSTTLPVTTTGGAKLQASLTVSITNSGNISPTPGSMISVYASKNGTVASGTLMSTSVFKTPLKPGKSAKVNFSLSKFPLLSPGSYSLVVQIIDPLSIATTVVSISKYAVT